MILHRPHPAPAMRITRYHAYEIDRPPALFLALLSAFAGAIVGFGFGLLIGWPS